MQPEEFPIQFLNNIDKDFKAEITAAEMVEQGTPEDRILILQIGAMKRSFRKDILSIEEELSEYDHKEYVVVKTPREGLYDMLPEGLFHHPSAHKSAQTEKEIIRAIKQRKEEEQIARKFFLPFEATINYLRMQMALYENQLDKRINNDELVNIFKNHWEIFQYLNAKEADLFLHLIPILHDIRDDHSVIGTIMEMMFELPVHISLRPQLPLHPTEPMLSRMGESVLGVDLCTGNSGYDEGEDEIVIKMGPVSVEEFQLFMPGGRKYQILDLLIGYFLPVHIDIVTEFELEERDKMVKLVEGKNYLNSVLGSDTFL